MGGCITKEKGSSHRDPVIVIKRAKRTPSLSIEANNLYKNRIDKERKEQDTRDSNKTKRAPPPNTRNRKDDDRGK